MKTYQINPDIQLEKVDFGAETQKYLLHHNGRRFYIGELVYLITSKLLEIGDIESVQKYLKESRGLVLTNDKLNEIIEYKIKPLGILEGSEIAPQKSRMSYIYGAITLMSENMIIRTVKHLTFLFNNIVFFTLISIAIGVHIAFFKDVPLSNMWDVRLSNVSDDVWLVGFLYIGFFTLLLCHEIGHAAATYSFGVKPQKIGFGFYFIFPVFFTDVSKIWILSKYKRIIVNIAGIYIQLIINSLLIFIYYFNPIEYFYLLPFVIVNLGIAVYSLNPFFRYDGYWIYSDLFNIPNLKKESSLYPRRFLNRIKGVFSSRNEPYQKPFWQEIPLLVYSFFNFLFWTYITYFFIIFLITSTRKLGYYYHDWVTGGSTYSVEDRFWFCMRTVFSYGLTIYFIGRYLNNYFNRKKLQTS